MPHVIKRPESTMRWLALLAVFAMAFGCEEKKKVLDIKAPGVDVEINQTEQGIEIDSKGNRNNK